MKLELKKIFPSCSEYHRHLKLELEIFPSCSEYHRNLKLELEKIFPSCSEYHRNIEIEKIFPSCSEYYRNIELEKLTLKLGALNEMKLRKKSNNKFKIKKLFRKRKIKSEIKLEMKQPTKQKEETNIIDIRKRKLKQNSEKKKTYFTEKQIGSNKRKTKNIVERKEDNNRNINGIEEIVSYKALDVIKQNELKLIINNKNKYKVKDQENGHQITINLHHNT
eukprot:13351_1